MKISMDFDKFDFHDSGIFSIKFVEDKQELIMEVKLAESDEYVGQPEGLLTFHGVDKFEFPDCLKGIDPDDMLGDVSSANYVEEDGVDNLEAVEWHMTIDNNYGLPQNCRLYFLAQSFTWSEA